MISGFRPATVTAASAALMLLASSTVYAAASGAPEGSVTPISTATNTAAKEIMVGMNPSAIAITPQAR
jgi:DNA-binding beta-propeller fold protein YncE